ncbi:MAG TPA: hypothetical protein VK509_09485 [Polyangiales bacterium]|nr:hypothetical protein [Polyangiales bacterium]
MVSGGNTPAVRAVGDVFLCKRHWLAEVAIARAKVEEATDRYERLLNAAQISSGEFVAEALR